MKSIKHAWKALLGIVVIALFPLILIGCAEGDKDAPEEKPATEHPTGDNAAAEHPTGDKAAAEHPTGDKAAAEHPTGEHPK